MRNQLIVTLLAILLSGATQAQLYGSNDQGELFLVDTSTGAATLVGTFVHPCTTAKPGVIDIEYDRLSDRAFAHISIGMYSGFEYSNRTAQVLGECIKTSKTYSAFETVHGAWFAIVDWGGELNRTDLYSFDPFNNEVGAYIGETGVGEIYGLAYDEIGGVMYGIQGSTNASDLYTIDLTTGKATIVGNTGIRGDGLQFGADGLLYAGNTGFGAGQLFLIDTQTGQSTLVGDTGMGSVTGLTLVSRTIDSAVPTLNHIALILLILILALVSRRAIGSRDGHAK